MPYANVKDKIAQRKRYYLKHKEKIIAASKEWAEKNKEQVKVTKHAYRQKLTREQKDLQNAKTRERYYNNIEKNKQRKKLYRSKNKHIGNANSAKRRAALINRTPKWLNNDDIIKIKNIYKYAQTKTIETNILWVVDHIIPLQGKLVSGLHVPSNLQIIKARENESKQHKYEVM